MLHLPPWFEDAVSSTARVNLRSSKALEEIAPVVDYLSRRFMRQEDSMPENYFSDAEIRRAYLAYFFSTNVLKCFPVLEELHRSDFFTSRRRIRALDIGTGVGTAAIGLWMWLAEHSTLPIERLDLLVTDASPDVCEEAARTITTFRKHLDAPLHDVESRAATLKALAVEELGTFDLIIAQNILVETPDYASLLALTTRSLSGTGALVLIEPASRYGSRTLLGCRDALVEAGFTIYAPCVRQSTCPALEKDSDWCHAISRWERPRFIRILDEQIGNLRLSLKYSYIVALKTPVNIGSTFTSGSGEMFRVVSDRIDEKGRKKLYGCGVSGRIFLEKQKRDTTEANEVFDEARRYDLLRINGFAPKATMQRLTPDSTVERVWRFEAPGGRLSGQSEQSDQSEGS